MKEKCRIGADSRFAFSLSITFQIQSDDAKIEDVVVMDKKWVLKGLEINPDTIILLNRTSNWWR